MTEKATRILWFDSLAGISVGLFVLLLHGWLSTLYGFTPELTRFIGAANLAYGCYSGSLALRASGSGRLSRPFVTALGLANIAWAMVCMVLLRATWHDAHLLGVASLGLEALFVGSLGVFELRVLRPLAN